MNFRTLLCALAALAASTCALAQAPPGEDHVDAALIAETNALAPGADNWVALRMLPDIGWHTYWQNPGDSGIPTKLTWNLPAGITAGQIQWPYPQRHSLGELTNYGYDVETLHLVQVHVPADWPLAKPVELKAEAKWLVCADICIPGARQVSLTLPVSKTPAPDVAWAEAFAHAHAALPVPRPDWDAQFAVSGGDVSVAVAAPELAGADAIEMYPLANDLVNHGTAQRLAHDAPDRVRISQHLSAYFTAAPATVDAVYVIKKGAQVHAYQASAKPGVVAVVAEAPAPAPVVIAAPPPAAAPGFLLVLLFALLGGLVLNLMPCVFPVLSLKALSVMQSRDGDRAHLRHALVYTAGVVLSCVIVAATLLALRAAGNALGWGFQLQSPAFVGVLCYLLFALGLSMSGAVQLGASLMGLGQSATAGTGYVSSFATGVLAVVVASPCTAPFMGTALGYALTQPAPVALLVFAMLGLGLALPFLLLGIFPRLAHALPRPGAWMETFRQAMAFPLYLTVAWLLWVLARQTDADGAALAMIGLVLVAFAMWLWNRAGWLALVLRAAALAAALALLFNPALQVHGSATHATSTDGWSPWSEAHVAELRAQRRNIFVDFTADWCLTCKVNERAALSSERVRATLAQKKVELLRADWTRADPAITHVLESFGRSGVPLYLVYVDGGEAKILPQILTGDIVVDAFNP
jgi:thiol:disulfide interchange protein